MSTADGPQIEDERKTTELFAWISERHPDWDLQPIWAFAIRVRDSLVIAASRELLTDIQTTAALSGSSTGIGTILSEIAEHAIDEQSQQIGVALEATVDLVVDGGNTPRAPARVLIERVAPGVAIVRYHPSQ
jgi:hypothetical protein